MFTLLLAIHTRDFKGGHILSLKRTVSIRGERSNSNLKQHWLSRHEYARLVHGWDSINNLKFHSLLSLSALTNVKCYPTMTKKNLRVDS